MNDEELDNVDDVVREQQKQEGYAKQKAKEKIRNTAGKKVKDATKKAAKAAKNTLVKPIGISIFSTILTVIIVIFMLIGIISFIFTMPGMVQEKIFNSIMTAMNELGHFINGESFYLDELANDREQTKQKEVLRYLDDMGIDPVGFGFAPFYTRTEDSEGNVTVDYMGSMASDDDPSLDSGGVISAWIYNEKMKEKTINKDLIFKYIVANERTYIPVDLDKKFFMDIVTSPILKSVFGTDLTGMLKIKIPGLDDASISVDREQKRLNISATNWSEFTKQTFSYNLENFTGRYGMPLEFLLALHISTMSSDLTDEMLSNDKLNTEVNITAEKKDYMIDYDITYKGQDFPMDFGKVGDFAKLYEHYNINQYLRKNEDGTYYYEIPEDKKEEIKKAVSICSLHGWIEDFSYNDFDEMITGGNAASTFVNNSSVQAIDALLGSDSYRTIYNRIASTQMYVTDGKAIRFSNYFGKVSEFEGNLSGLSNTLNYTPDFNYLLNEDTWAYSGTSQLGMLSANGYKEGTENTEVNLGVIYDTTDINIAHPVYLDTKYAHKYTSQQKSKIEELLNTNFYTVYKPNRAIVTHGLQYYIDGNIDELKNNIEQCQALTAMLSQLDAYFYINNLENLIDASFVKCKINDDSTGEYVIPSGLNMYFSDYDTKSNLDRTGDDTYLLLTKKWLDFYGDGLSGKSNDDIKTFLIELKTDIESYADCLSNKDESVTDLLNSLLEALDMPLENITSGDIVTIYNILKDEKETVEFAMPRITTVIKHWYKDIIFESKELGVDVYRDTDQTISIPYDVENEDLEVYAKLSGKGSINQDDPPFVVKGDVVTLDGKVVEDSNLSGGKVKDSKGNWYTLGDGYRTTKKLFTQGMYYAFDGTGETAQSIWYAKELEKLGTKLADGSCEFYGVIRVKNGRITGFYGLDDDEVKEKFGEAYDFSNDKWNISAQTVAEERKGENLGEPVIEGDGWSVFLAHAHYSASGENVNHYYIVVDKPIAYKSPADYSYEESKASAEKINAILTAAGVVTQRKPISFDNTAEGGDITTLTAFSILENSKTSDSQYIYRDLKELLIELGYYTKAEFEYIDTDVLTWFIPDYIPADPNERIHWAQNKDEDILDYGAIIYPESTGEEGEDGETGEEVEDGETGEEGEDGENNTETKKSHSGFASGLDVVAPGNCRILECEDGVIVLEFDGVSQPEIGILNKYTMIINGIQVSDSDVIKILGESEDEEDAVEMTIREAIDNEEIIKVGTVIGVTGEEKIQVIMKDAKGAKINNIEDYMAPALDTPNAQVPDIARFYFIPYEGGTPGCVSNPSNKREVAVGIGQWTSYGATNNVPYACKWLYEKDPTFCKELRTFIGWTTEQVCADYIDGGGQLVAAFKTIEARDKDRFMQLQMELIMEEKMQLLNSRGFAWLEERNPVTIGTVWSLYNWGPNMGWENHFDESMTDEQIIISLLKYASTQSSTAGDLSSRWNSQARLALEILNGTFTDVDGWINNKAGYPEYCEGNNPGYLSTK